MIEKNLLKYRLPAILLKSRGFITTLQLISLILFLTAVIRGFIYPTMGENRFTTGLFWGLFWPLFIFLTTPVLGKVICMVCPHRLLIFRLAAPFSLKKKPPKWMRGGYLSLAAVMLLYWLPVYTWPGLFHNPFNTALYFTIFTLMALAITLLFRPSTWCSGLCPIAVPTNLVSRTAFMGLRTDKQKCDDCKIATCVVGRENFDGCPHGINPSLMVDNSDCTLCMRCIKACSFDAVTFGFIRPLSEFTKKRLKADMPEALGVVLLLGALTFTMLFYNGFYKGMMKEGFPLYPAAIKLESWMGGVTSGDGYVGLLTFILSLSISFAWFGVFSFTSAALANSSTKKAFSIMAWSAIPVFALSSLAQMSEFFFFRYYPMIADGFLDLLGFATGTAPIVSSHAPWLLLFKIISIGGGLWSLVFTWQLSGRLSDKTAARAGISFPFWFLHIMIMSAFAGQVIFMLFLGMPGVTGPR